MASLNTATRTATGTALKTAEGTVKLYSTFLKEGFGSSLLAKIGYLFAKRALARVKVRTDPRRYNGAMCLGLTGIAVKSHGGTDALGFANAVGVAIDLVTHGFNDRIRKEIERLNSTNGSPSGITTDSPTTDSQRAAGAL